MKRVSQGNKKQPKKRKGRRGSQAPETYERHMSKPSMKTGKSGRNVGDASGRRRSSTNRRSSVHMHGVFGKDVTKKSFHAPDTLKKSMERANSMYEHKIQEKDNKYIESLKDEMLGEMETRDLLQCLVFLVGMAVFIYYDTFKSHNYDPNAVPGQRVEIGRLLK
eukprot:g4249.t1